MRRHRTISIVFAATLALSACGGGEADSTTTTEPPATTSTESTTGTTTAPTTTAPSTTSTTRPPTTGTTLPGGDLVACESPEGYVISYPASWEANPGAVLPACGQFHPEPFEVTPTEERTAAIVVRIDPIPFHEVIGPDGERDARSAVAAIDGLQAVRLEYETSEDGIHAPGVAVTTYAIDLSTGVDDGRGTMFVDTLDLPGFDYARSQVVLDRMAPTIDVTLAGVETDPAVVARYEGGGGGFVLGASVEEGRVCLRVRPDGDASCVRPPSSAQGFETTTVADGEIEHLAGVVGPEVFLVRIGYDGGGPLDFVASRVPGAGVGAFAFPVDPDSVETIALFDVLGRELGRGEFESEGASAP